ncbi:hypothetical protein PC110_g23162 [Phytophthora cactorum]|uniref:Uncharacterized protein n=1 Tax=Phytophthora cactorum TaxID=29920 RepID=A0A329R982_9STRA|nr:hypothetical protein PC110_g23162 [Phytophthora cactorum]
MDATATTTVAGTTTEIRTMVAVARASKATTARITVAIKATTVHSTLTTMLAAITIAMCFAKPVKTLD